jgi:hypothetical protein
MTEAETKQRQDEARMMAIAQKQRSITLEILRQRFKCSGQEAFAVIQGQDLESETRNKIFAFLCPPPPPPAPSPPPEPEPAPAPVVPRVPVVANFLVPTRKEREAARAAEAARGPTDKVPITLLNDEQAAAMFELSESAVELHRTTKENNAAGLRYRRALARAEAVGVRFVTTNQPPPTNPPPNPA